jgi:hypothetical protein
MICSHQNPALLCRVRVRKQADTVRQADGMPSETPASPPNPTRARAASLKAEMASHSRKV